MINFGLVAALPQAADLVTLTVNRQPSIIATLADDLPAAIALCGATVAEARESMSTTITTILKHFPFLPEMHPFYADLIAGLFDDDDQLSAAPGVLGKALRQLALIERHYMERLRRSESIIDAKETLREALGCVATVALRLGPTLDFLERVRANSAKVVPRIDPQGRTLLVTGFPNVGKSSFVNTVTRADVEVQPYAFTTKFLFVGHFEHDAQSWQVIDTPGILDHALEERNVIEMQAITALAHLRATILFFMDLSGQCGYTIAQQLSLFHSIRPLFTGKPLVVVLNKCDVATLDDVSPAEHDAVMSAIESSGAKWIATSTLTDIGVGDLKTLACDALLEHRAEQKAGTARYESMQNRLFCAEPKRRDNVQRTSYIPDSVLQAREVPDDERVYRKTERDLEWENGGPGQYQYNERLTWDLENPEWVDDIMPEFMDGKNVADFIDPDILERLDELEAEEERRVARSEIEETKTRNAYSLEESTKEAVAFIRDKIKILKMERAMRNPAIVRTRSQQVAIDKFNSRTGSQSSARGPAEGKKRGRSLSAHAEEAFARERSGSHVSTKSTRSLSGRTSSRDRTMSVTRGEGFKDVSQKLRAVKLAKIKARPRAREAKKGEADRAIPNVMPKHLFSGKMKTNGKRDRR